MPTEKGGNGEGDEDE